MLKTAVNRISYEFPIHTLFKEHLKPAQHSFHTEVNSLFTWDWQITELVSELFLFVPFEDPMHMSLREK